MSFLRERNELTVTILAEKLVKNSKPKNTETASNDSAQFVIHTDYLWRILPMTNNKSDAREKVYLEIPVWRRYTLTIEEAAGYYHIGEGKLRMLIDQNPHEDFYVMNGNRALIKRQKFERYLDQATAV